MRFYFFLYSIVFFLFLSLKIRAQDVFFSGSRSQALAGISVCLADGMSISGNQAGLAVIDRPTAGISIYSPLLINELSSRSGHFSFPILSTSVFAFSVCQFGRDAFRQEKYGLAYAQRIDRKFRFGIQFNYHRFLIAEENQSIDLFGTEFGFQYQLSQIVTIGIHTKNPYQLSVKTFSNEISYPSFVNAGIYYQLSTTLGIATEIEAESSNQLNIKTGLEYCILSRFQLRLGLASSPHLLSAGLGFIENKLKIDMAVSYNQFLGNSPSVSFQYQF